MMSSAQHHEPTAEFSIIEIVEMIMADGHDLRMRLLNKYHPRFTMAAMGVEKHAPELEKSKPVASQKPPEPKLIAKSRRNWTSGVDADIALRRAAGESGKSLAQFYDCDEQTIWNRLYIHKKRVGKVPVATKPARVVVKTRAVVDDGLVVPPSDIPERHKRQARRFDLAQFLKTRGQDIVLVKGEVFSAGVELSDDALLARVNAERSRMGLTPTSWGNS